MLTPCLMGLLAQLLFTADNDDRQICDTTALSGSGIIEEINQKNGMNGYGIVRLRLLRSSVRYYQPAGKFDYYNCAIDSPLAECYMVLGPSYASVGDTLEFDNAKGIKTLKRLDGSTITGDFGVYQREDFYNWVRKKSIFDNR